MRRGGLCDGPWVSDAPADWQARLGVFITKIAKRTKVKDHVLSRPTCLRALRVLRGSQWLRPSCEPGAGLRPRRPPFYASAMTTPAAASSPPELTFLRSEDAGRWHVTTLGMHQYRLPELQMKRIAGNHCRAARFLLSVAAARIAQEAQAAAPEKPRDGEWFSGREFTLSSADVPPNAAYLVAGREPIPVESGEAKFRLALQTMTTNERAEGRWDAELLAVLPPAAFAGDADEWLRVTCRCLGQDTPAARPMAAQNDELQRASAEARTSLPAIRARFAAGLGDRTLLVKTALPTRAGGEEYVWVEVTGWRDDGILTGTLAVRPVDCPGYRQGQEMEVREGAVFDRTILSPDGTAEPALTDIVAQDFGLDIDTAPGRVGWRNWIIIMLATALVGLFRMVLGIVRLLFRGAKPQPQFDQAQLDQVARNMVESTRKMLTQRPEYVSTNAAEFAHLDLAAYDAAAQSLAALGLPAVGDVADAAFNRANPAQRAFYRIGLSADGTIAWKYFALRAGDNPAVEHRTLVLQTWLDDDRVLATARIEPPIADLFPTPPDIVKERVPPGTTDAAAVSAHRARVASAGAPARTLPDLAAILTLTRQEEDRTARYRQDMGPEIYRAIVLNSKGEEGRALADAIVRTIAAHPEWQ